MKTRHTFLALALLLLAAVPLAAQTAYDWSSVGSCGIMPYGGAQILTGPTMQIGSPFRGTVTARYPVTNTYGSATSDTPPWTTLTIAYTDDSASGSVTGTLYAIDKCTGTQTQVCQVVSSDGSNSPQCSSCTFSSSTIDFLNNEYYVEVKVARSVSTANEKIHSLGIN